MTAAEPLYDNLKCLSEIVSRLHLAASIICFCDVLQHMCFIFKCIIATIFMGALFCRALFGAVCCEVLKTIVASQWTENAMIQWSQFASCS